MNKLLAPLILLLASLPAMGQKIVAPVGPVAPFRFVDLRVDEPNPDHGYLWEVSPPELADIRNADTAAMTFIGPPGAYRVKLVAYIGEVVEGKVRVRVKSDVATVRIEPPPPPTPPTPVNPVNPVDPNPVDPPKPPPAPVSNKLLRAFILTDQYSPDYGRTGRFAIAYSRALENRLNAITPAEDGYRAWRRYDRVTDVSQQTPNWQEAFKQATAKTQTYPALVLFTASGVESIPLPATEAEALALLQRFEGPN